MPDVFGYVMVIGTPLAAALGWFGAKFLCERSERKIDREMATHDRADRMTR